MAYAQGKYAKFISDRSGLEFPYSEMVTEWNGSKVHTSEYEPKAAQLMPQEHRPDPQALEFARPDRTENSVAVLLPLNPFRFTSGSTTVNVFSPSHGRSTSDVVRFYDVSQPLLGTSIDEIKNTSGLTITVVDENIFSIPLTTAANTTGIGGGTVTAGPVTLVS
tara:strand:+ start:1224 stop:1715 length:492 start_codon:yes stop_codon:yes gene_type:complete